MSNLENTIKGYLDKRAEEDPLFAESYKKPGKSIKEMLVTTLPGRRTSWEVLPWSG